RKHSRPCRSGLRQLATRASASRGCGWRDPERGLSARRDCEWHLSCDHAHRGRALVPQPRCSRVSTPAGTLRELHINAQLQRILVKYRYHWPIQTNVTRSFTNVYCLYVVCWLFTLV